MYKSFFEKGKEALKNKKYEEAKDFFYDALDNKPEFVIDVINYLITTAVSKKDRNTIDIAKSVALVCDCPDEKAYEVVDVAIYLNDKNKQSEK